MSSSNTTRQLFVFASFSQGNSRLQAITDLRMEREAANTLFDKKTFKAIIHFYTAGYGFTDGE